MNTTPPGGSPGSGTLSGSVYSVGVPCPEPKPGCDGPAASHEVVVYAEDGKTVAGKATTDTEGKFSLTLPEGKYVIVMPAGPPPDEPDRIEVSISRDALSQVELRLDTGVRAAPAPTP